MHAPKRGRPVCFLGDFKQHWYTGATEHSAFCLSQRFTRHWQPSGAPAFLSDGCIGGIWAFGHLGIWNSPGRFQQYSRAGPTMRFSRNIICLLYRTDKYCQRKHRSPLLIVTYLVFELESRYHALTRFSPKTKEVVDGLGPQHPVGSC